MSKLDGISEVETMGEQPLTGEGELRLLKKAEAIPRQKSGLSRAIFVTLKKV